MPCDLPWQIVTLFSVAIFAGGALLGMLTLSLVQQPPTVYQKGYEEGYERGHVEGFSRGRLYEARDLGSNPTG